MQLQQATIAMPNELFLNLKEWLVLGKLKSVQHQEFTYSYYWILAYFWRYALYAEQKIGQPEIKQMLGYNPNDKRLNYIIKKNGLLNEENYTLATPNYPVAWNMKKDEDVSFDMIYDFDVEDRKFLSPNQSRSFFAQSPVKHLGDTENDGIYWNSSNTHIVGGDIFDECMKNDNLSCAGFYLYGILTFIRDKSMSGKFLCANKTLIEYTGWSKNRVCNITNELVSNRLISKEQSVKRKGSVNEYEIY